MRRTPIVSSVFACVALAAGCTVYVDEPSDGGTYNPYPYPDTGVPGTDGSPDVVHAWEAGRDMDAMVPPPVDSALPETSVAADVGVPAQDTGLPGVIVRAQDLIDPSLLGSGEVEVSTVTDLGFGSTTAEISANRLAYAIATVDGFPELTSAAFGRDAAGNLQEVRLSGWPSGTTSVKILVTGYLRGTNQVGTLLLSQQPVPWATAECRADLAAAGDVVASCEKLQVLGDLRGVLVTADVVPPGYCQGKSPGSVRVRARTPESGIPLATRSVECGGVLWFPEAEFAWAQTAEGFSTWTLTLEVGDTACARTQPCTVQRTSELPIRLLDDRCGFTAATTTPGCF